MNSQFDTEAIDFIDPYKNYYCSPLLTEATGFTLLMKWCLCYHRDPTIVSRIREYLHEHPETINEKNSKGWTALILSARNSAHFSSNSIVATLIEFGADMNAHDAKRWTALTTACKNIDRGSTLTTIQLLLDAGANINIMTDDGSILNILCYNYIDNMEPVLKLLFQKGINPNLVDRYGYTALHDINYRSHPISVHQVLLEAGVPINTLNNNGETPLMMTFRQRPVNFDLISLYLDYGADISVKNNLGYTVLDIIKDQQLKDFILNYDFCMVKEPDC